MYKVDEWGETDFDTLSPDGEYINDAVHFGAEYDDSDVRLYAIMMNIVKNGGDFKPLRHIAEESVKLAMLNPKWGEQYL